VFDNGPYPEPCGICQCAAGLTSTNLEIATVWVLPHDLAGYSVCRVPTRRNPYPDWVLARRTQLSHRIAALRRQARLSQDQLAVRAGLDRRSIQRYEAGERDPRYADLLLLADALDVTLADLVG
jgi:DNA-binding XRE family transcriptional regulator